MRSLHVITIVICFLVTLSECDFSSATIVELDPGTNPDFVFYSGESLFIVFHANTWGEQPILSKIDPTTGEYLFNFTIPFTRCYPCYPLVNGIQVLDGFVAITVENGTLWEIFTFDTEQLVLSDTYIPTNPGFIEDFFVNGADSIIICNDLVNHFFEVNTYLVTYGENGHSIALTQVNPTKPSGVVGFVYGVANIVPDMTLACIDPGTSGNTKNYASIETPTGKISSAVNYGWSYSCPITSVSSNLQSVCAYYTLSSPTQQALWCWNYTLYETVIPPTNQQFTQPGIAYDGVADDSGNFIGCYADNSNNHFLIQYSVNYNQSTYDVVSTAAIKDGYHCSTQTYARPVMNYRISSTLSQVAQLVTKSSQFGQVYAYLLANYDSA